MEGNNVKSFENLCRIFEMRIKLDKEKNINTPNEVLENYEKYAKKIDNIYNEEFEKELRPLISPAQDIDKEKDRLEKLISIVTKRLDKRNDLEERYHSTTGEYILSLQTIVSDKELEDKKKRLDNITRYIDNNNEINSIKESIEELNHLLEEEEKKKEEYNEKNKIMEDDLYSEFTRIIKEDVSFENIDEDNIDEELASTIPLAKEYKETLDVTKDSINSLIENGIDDDYNSYIEEANKSYYLVKNKELLLKIYKLVLNIKTDFNEIFDKRDNLNNLLEERRSLVKNLNITDLNALSKFEDILFEQLKTINNEKEVLDNIANYNSRIEFKKSRLEQLEEDNEDAEILSILKEFNLVETYDNQEFTEETKIELPEEKIEVEEINPYRIKEVVDAPYTLNLGLARLKGETVREKVNKKLNPPIEKVSPLPEKEVPLWEVKPIEENTKNNDPVVPTWNAINPVEEQPNNITDKENITESLDNNTVSSIEINTVPLWEPQIPNIENNNLNSNEFPNIMVNESNVLNELPDIISTDNNNINVNEFPNMMTNENNNVNVNEKTDNDDMPTAFWVPLSEEKLENGTMPDLDLTNN